MYPPKIRNPCEGSYHEKVHNIQAKCVLGKEGPRIEPLGAENNSPVGGGGLVAKLCSTLATPWIVAHQASLSIGFP